ncbi:MAG: hypothetical protein KA803_16865 [Rhodoferax sp.]|nr:hypothetical protein [Rhodoferax sp.]
MPSFDTTVGEGNAPVTVFYDCDCDGVIEIDEVWHVGQRITATLTQATVDQIETEAMGDYKKHCEERRDDCAISRYESQQEAA